MWTDSLISRGTAPSKSGLDKIGLGCTDRIDPLAPGARGRPSFVAPLDLGTRPSITHLDSRYSHSRVRRLEGRSGPSSSRDSGLRAGMADLANATLDRARRVHRRSSHGAECALPGDPATHGPD